jgi:hypothetical protein
VLAQPEEPLEPEPLELVPELEPLEPLEPEPELPELPELVLAPLLVPELPEEFELLAPPVLLTALEELVVAAAAPEVDDAPPFALVEPLQPTDNSTSAAARPRASERHSFMMEDPGDEQGWPREQHAFSKAVKRLLGPGGAPV